MSRPGLLRSRSALLAAGGASALLHVGVVVVCISWLGRVNAIDPSASNVDGLRAAWKALTAPAASEVAAWEAATEVAMVVESEVLPERWQSRHVGDDATSVVETAPRLANGLDPRKASSDGGDTGGATPQDTWRADRQTLRAQLLDGAATNHTARSRVGKSLASSQAERREPSTGIGDAPRTARASLSLTSDPAAATSQQTIKTGREEALRERAGTLAQTGAGPLDAKLGARRFDTETVGAAADVMDQRSASTERRPAPIDLAVATSPGALIDSHLGPDATPGAVAGESRGHAPSVYGADAVLPYGAKVALNAREAQRARYERAIRQQALSQLKFPRKLALLLAQGETIVRFAVGADGTVSASVDVTKSAGFREFDEAATAAVKRAAPFPHMPEPLVVNMRFVFENPVLR